MNVAEVVGIYAEKTIGCETPSPDYKLFHEYEDLLDACDAVYLAPHTHKRFEMVNRALHKGRHEIRKSPATLNGRQCKGLIRMHISQRRQYSL